ncbi:MAG: hypothetical protein AAFN59_12030, partial [Pseudomonadota bacterium]
MKRLFLCIICALPLACTQLPAFEGSPAAQRAPYPTLLPFNAVYGAPTGPSAQAVNLLAGTDIRARNLRARAAAMRSSNDIETI